MIEEQEAEHIPYSGAPKRISKMKRSTQDDVKNSKIRKLIHALYNRKQPTKRKNFLSVCSSPKLISQQKKKPTPFPMESFKKKFKQFEKSQARDAIPSRNKIKWAQS